jgi:hypothetical protein
MKVDYFFEEIKGMDIEDAVAYLRELLTLGSDEDIYPTEDEKVYRLLLASPQYLERVKENELYHDFLILEGIDPDLPYEYQTADYTDWEEEEEWEEWDSPCYADYDRALQEVEDQEDKYLEDCLKVMMTESHDREAAEHYVAYGEFIHISNWHIFSKYVNMFTREYPSNFNAAYPSEDEFQELDKDLYPSTEIDIDELNTELDDLLML